METETINPMTNPEASLYERIGGKAGLQKLLRHFYADVRQNNTIGPIFNRKIENWPEHVATIAEFWSRLTGGPSEYAGGMPAKHLPLGIDGRHFAEWLQLWDFNCARYLKPQEAKEMSELAHGIGERLRGIVAVHGVKPEV